MELAFTDSSIVTIFSEDAPLSPSGSTASSKDYWVYLSGMTLSFTN